MNDVEVEAEETAAEPRGLLDAEGQAPLDLVYWERA